MNRGSGAINAAGSEEWQTSFSQAGLKIENMEFFRKTHHYDDWTLRSQLPVHEKAALERFI